MDVVTPQILQLVQVRLAQIVGEVSSEADITPEQVVDVMMAIIVGTLQEMGWPADLLAERVAISAELSEISSRAATAVGPEGVTTNVTSEADLARLVELTSRANALEARRVRRAQS